MMAGKGNRRSGKFYAAVACAVLICTGFSSPALALVLNRPVPHGMSDTFRIRGVHPVTGAQGAPHRGIDFLTPTGTQISVPQASGGRTQCTTEGGYGNVGNVYYECPDGTTIMEKFAHLQSCSPSTLHTDSTGQSTGPHLHYEIRINGTVVDPQVAWGRELCDPETREELIEDANNKLNGLAGDGEGTGGVPPDAEPPDDDTVIIGYPPGEEPPAPGDPDYDEYQGDPYRPGDTPGYGEPGRRTGPADPVIYTPPNGDPPSGCATDTWGAMVNQALLESRRENIMNQRYIAKPDSVLAYSCFTGMLDSVRNDAGPVFSETDRWANVQVDILGKTVTVQKELGPQSLDAAMATLVYEVYERHLDTNFAHAYLGGTMSSGNEEGMDAHGMSQAYAPCGAMKTVWNMAQCRNADDPSAFYTFEELISTDPREFPGDMPCNLTEITQAMIDTAKGAQTRFDDMETHLDYLRGGPDACQPPIMTGVIVHRMVAARGMGELKKYPDGICSNAGCSYVKSSMDKQPGVCKPGISIY